MLEKMGYEVDLVDNGEQALKAFEKYPYAVILMDCQMPVMDGYEASRRIRAHEETHRWKTPIIAMTAHALEGDRQKCMAAGMSDYLSKPFKTQELEALLHRWSQPLDIAEQEHIRQVLKDKPDELDLLYADFEQDTQKQMQAIAQGINQKDAFIVESASHHIKGASGSLGAFHLHEIASRLEQHGRCKLFDDIGPLFEAMQESYFRITQSLKNRRPSQVLQSRADKLVEGEA